MSLISAIDDYKQKEHIKSDKELARLLGISRDFIVKIRAGKREPGNKVFRAMRQHPELKLALLNYFMGGGK